ncbi:mechanosensitive ion channel family protein [Thalassovita sp.]|uniref:mechanosensitive ion channel family protein n=1 Tax=Thalassovita sp. TaxID=1979401 RepID=UPI0029DE78B8|nr:mechanosensitive ion channel domain-containing protein [Thalassovita sp.]
MESEIQSFLAAFETLWTAVAQFIRTMMLPSRQIQLVAVAAAAGLAWVVGRKLSARMDAWIRGLSGRPKWQLRWLVVLRKRLPLFLFALLLWSLAGGFAVYYEFPSRRYVLTLFATIATAWFFIRIAAELIRNRFLRRLVIWGLSIYATLYYVGMLESTTVFLDGLAIEFGDFRLSALAVLKALVVTGLLLYLARMMTATGISRIRGNKDISPSMQELSAKFLQLILYGAAFFIGLKAVGFDLTGLAVLSGAIGVGLGFGLQKVVSNLVSGIIILMDKSIKPGDVISLGDTFGWINSLGARYVSISTRDGREYLIPNEDLITGQVVNWSHSSDLVRLEVRFGTSYNDNPYLVREVAIKAAASVSRVLSDPAPVCHVLDFGDSSVNFTLRFWITDPTLGLANIRSGVFLALWDAFQEHGISIPFPQREVKVLPGSELNTRPSPPQEPQTE